MVLIENGAHNDGKCADSFGLIRIQLLSRGLNNGVEQFRHTTGSSPPVVISGGIQGNFRPGMPPSMQP